jgi:hypothetical protein
VVEFVGIFTAQVGTQETFFNVSFWRQLVGVLLGAFLAVSGGLCIQFLLQRSRRQTVAAMARSTLARELLEILRSLDHMEKLSRSTKANPPPAPAWIVESPPNPGVLRQLVAPDVLGALTPEEHRHLLLVVSNLEDLNRRYESWVTTVTSAQHLLSRVRDPGSGTVRPYWEVKTDTLLYVVAAIRIHVMDLLIMVCVRARHTLIDEQAERIRTSLMPLRWRKTGSDFYRSARSSDVQRAEFEGRSKHLVVWEHDWPECPLEVIELKRGGGDSGQHEA